MWNGRRLCSVLVAFPCWHVEGQEGLVFLYFQVCLLENTSLLSVFLLFRFTCGMSECFLCFQAFPGGHMEAKGAVCSSSCLQPSYVKTKKLKGRVSVFPFTLSQMDVCFLCLWPFHVDMFAIFIFYGAGIWNRLSVNDLTERRFC